MPICRKGPLGWSTLVTQLFCWFLRGIADWYREALYSRAGIAHLMVKEMISDLGVRRVAIHPRLVRSLRSQLKTGFFATRGDNHKIERNSVFFELIDFDAY